MKTNFKSLKSTNMIKTHKLDFKPGLIVNQEFFDYPAMQESAKNWLFLARYRFDTGDFYGRHDGIQLHNLQFGHADRHEGMMFEGLSPSNCFTIAILQKSSGTVCINHNIMEVGDVIIIDDTKSYDFCSSHHSVMAIVSINKLSLIKHAPWLLNSIDKKLKDNENILSHMIEDEWQSILDKPHIYKDNNKLQLLENKIIDAIESALCEQVAQVQNLTKGEKTAFKIKYFLLNSLEENITIADLAKQFDISDKTLESSFKSLFGITPKHFLNLLKLNRAHEDLQLAESNTTNVSEIAMKWGFPNFGRFSKNYKALFGVLPSETLSKGV